MSEKRKTLVIRGFWLFIIAVFGLLPAVRTETARAIDGCSEPITSSDYGNWSDLSDFNISNVVQNADGHLTLDSAGTTWEQDGIALNAVKDISVTYVYRDGDVTGAKLGWLYETDVDQAGSTLPDETKIRWIYDSLGDVQDAGSKKLLTDLLTDPGSASIPYGSNAKIVFVVEMNGVKLYYTKSSWNGAFGSGCSSPNDRYRKEIQFYDLFENEDDICRKSNDTSFDPQGWLSSEPFNWLQGKGYTFQTPETNKMTFELRNGDPTPQSILAAPDNTQNALVLGFEVTNNLYDFNDLVFLLEYKSLGLIQLKNEAAMTPAGYHGFYTQLEFEAWDGMPQGSEVNYYYSVYFLVDQYANYILDADGQKIPVWHKIEASDWSEVHSFTAEDGTARLAEDKTPITNETDIAATWSMGNPVYTHRKAVIDLVAKSVIGRDLLWKAELTGDSGETAPTLIDVNLSALVSSETVSRSVPVVQTNVLYSGSFELPDPLDADWFNDPEARGHLKAIMIYDPETARASEADRSVIWDAGVELSISKRDIGTSPRTIYFPSMSKNSYPSEALVSIQSGKSSYAGTLANVPVLDGTFVIKDNAGKVLLEDSFNGNELAPPSESGIGYSIDLDSGEYTIQLGEDLLLALQETELVADYSSYSITGSSLQVLGTNSVPDALFNLETSQDDISQPTNSELVKWIRGYKKNGSSEQRTWLLGAIDHSAPAVMTPPGFPEWFFGSAVPDDGPMKTSFYDPTGAKDWTFRAINENREVVVFVGARDGMLHAFDGGRFNWGDNANTVQIEHRGHFVWSGDTKETAQYGTGEELWAYIPGNLLGKMKNIYNKTGDSEAWLDASPALGDVYINDEWRTVLIVCQGNGGHMVTCLDVTDPASPALVWEIGDPDLFNSRSSPVIGMIDPGKWVAFLLSGVTDPNDDPVIYMIDIDTGVITKIPLDDAGAEGEGGVGSGQPAAVDSDGDGYVDRLYVGTDKGFMYRVAVEGGDFSDIVINSSERNANEGIYGSPAVVTDADGVRVFFGTGGDDSATTYHFYAYLDNKRGSTDNYSPSLQWSYALQAGHRVYASVFAAAGQVYFSTTTAVTEDPCEAGGASEGKLYAFKQVLDPADASFGPLGEIPLPTGSGRVAPIVDDQHLYIKTAFGTLESVGGTTYNNEAAGVANGEVALPIPEATIYSWREVH